MTRSLRVVHVIARMNVGGPAVLIASTMRGMDRDQFQIRLITGYCDEDEADYIDTQAPDVSAERLEGLGRSVRPWSDLTSLSALASRFRALRPDIIHTHTAKAGLLGRAAATMSGVDAAVVHTFHGHLLNGYFSPGKTRAITSLEKALARRTDRLVAVGPRVREDLLAAGVGRPENFVVIPPGVDTPPQVDRVVARMQLGLDPDRPVVAMIGRLTGIKRPDRFADMVDIIRGTHPGIQFIVAGAGNEEEPLRRSVDARGLPVSMLGWRSDIGTLLGASDALVLTSDNEGTPLSLIQAGLSGLPVVATRVGSVADVVSDGETGLLCEANARALANAVVGVVEDPQMASALGSAARTRMTERFGIPTMLKAHATLYREVAAERGR